MAEPTLFVATRNKRRGASRASLSAAIPLPSGVMDLLREAHAHSPITRIRVAYMQDGFAAAQNAAPEPPNPVSILIGHQVLGFTTFEP